jgi:hypothetical protein
MPQIAYKINQFEPPNVACPQSSHLRKLVFINGHIVPPLAWSLTRVIVEFAAQREYHMSVTSRAVISNFPAPSPS